MIPEQMLTVSQAAKLFPIFSEAALRHLIRKAPLNGLAHSIKRVNGRVYLVESAFRTWLAGKADQSDDTE